MSNAAFWLVVLLLLCMILLGPEHGLLTFGIGLIYGALFVAIRKGMGG